MGDDSDTLTSISPIMLPVFLYETDFVINMN